MNKERLKKLRSLIKESEHLQTTYDDLLCFPQEEVVDSVKDYRTGYPRTITIAGYGDGDFPDLRQKLFGKLRLINKEIAYLEEQLEGVEDPEVRDILRLQYIDGLTQEEIADELGYSVITIKRRLREFWKDDTE